MVAPIKFEFAI